MNFASQPSFFSVFATALESMQYGRVMHGSARMFHQALSSARAAVVAMQQHDLAGSLRDRGFTHSVTSHLLRSQSMMVQGLQVFHRAAAMGGVALAYSAADSRSLASKAQYLETKAERILDHGWAEYETAVTTLGLGPPPAINGIPAPTASPLPPGS